MKKLKPIVFLQGDRSKYRQNNYAQNLILKALTEGITDPNELKKITGMKTAAEVYRTLDKMALRKEYHEALAKNNIDFDYIVNGIKGICDTSEHDSTKLKGYQTLLRSLGLDKYDKQEDSGKGWEDILVQLSDANPEEMKAIEGEVADYEIVTPATPETERKKRDDERELGRTLYE